MPLTVTITRETNEALPMIPDDLIIAYLSFVRRRTSYLHKITYSSFRFNVYRFISNPDERRRFPQTRNLIMEMDR